MNMGDAGIARTESARYWITPVKDTPVESAVECIGNLVGREHIYAFGETIPARKRIKPGDWICFYATRKGVVGYARVASLPRWEEHPAIIHPGYYPWVIDLDRQVLFLDNPTVIDEDLRERMDEFADKPQNHNWGWLVLTIRDISKHDFRLLIRQEGTS